MCMTLEGASENRTHADTDLASSNEANLLV